MSDKNENVCCGAIEELAEIYDRPFEKPFGVEEGEFKVYAWSLRLMKLTPAGNISEKHGMNSTVLMSFCPFCGKDLREQETLNLLEEGISDYSHNGGE